MSDSEVTEQDILPIDITFDDSPSQSLQNGTSSPQQNQEYGFKFGLNQFPGPFAAQNLPTANFGFDNFTNF
jgi:hypothetical protein